MLTSETIKAIIQEAIRETRCECYPDEHKTFIDAMILREKRKAELFQSVQEQVLGWGAIALVGTIGVYLADKIKTVLLQ